MCRSRTVTAGSHPHRVSPPQRVFRQQTATPSNAQWPILQLCSNPAVVAHNWRSKPPTPSPRYPQRKPSSLYRTQAGGSSYHIQPWMCCSLTRPHTQMPTVQQLRSNPPDRRARRRPAAAALASSRSICRINKVRSMRRSVCREAGAHPHLATPQEKF